jgi:hypothetical protein
MHDSARCARKTGKAVSVLGDYPTITDRRQEFRRTACDDVLACPLRLDCRVRRLADCTCADEPARYMAAAGIVDPTRRERTGMPVALPKETALVAYPRPTAPELVEIAVAGSESAQASSDLRYVPGPPEGRRA